MKTKILIVAALSIASASAMAADLAPRPYAKNPVYVPPEAAYDWSGFYAGVHAGYARGDVNVIDTNGGVNPGPFGYRTDGGFAGGQLGYNVDFNHFVAGVEADFAYLGNSGSGIIGSAAADHHQDLTLGNGLLADVTGRLGYSFGPVLLYAKGGYAYFGGSAAQTTTNPGYVTTGTGGWSGYTFGGGAEYQLTRNWSLKAEYLRYDFGSRDGYQTNVGDLTSPKDYQFHSTTSLKMDTFKVGANYRF